jgi:DNA mismatch repair protein MutL
VSPTKSEIRFRDVKYTQKMVTDAIKKNLKQFDRIVLGNAGTFPPNNDTNDLADTFLDRKVVDYLIDRNDSLVPFRDGGNSILSKISFNGKVEVQPQTFENFEEVNFFGTPVCQIFDSYIITEKDDSIIIIDQHAVHEKITQTQILKDIEAGRKQYLIASEMIEITDGQMETFAERKNDLQNCGFEIALSVSDNQKSLIITAIPPVLDEKTAIEFIKEIVETGEKLRLPDAIRLKIADVACHNSIRFGRKMSMIEMKALIRQMEETESIHQCNHHRPSFVKITKTQLGKMFHRN